jgi:hypothetical protein
MFCAIKAQEETRGADQRSSGLADSIKSRPAQMHHPVQPVGSGNYSFAYGVKDDFGGAMET